MSSLSLSSPPANQDSIKRLFSSKCMCCVPRKDSNSLKAVTLNFNCIGPQRNFTIQKNVIIPDIRNCWCVPCK